MTLRYSKPWAWLVLALNLFFVAWAGFWLLAGLVDGNALWLMMGGAASLAVAPVVAHHVREPLRALRSDDAVVVLDAEGIYDFRNAQSFVRWRDVAKVQLGGHQGARNLLILRLRDSQAARLRAEKGDAGRRLFGRLLLLGDWDSNLRPLACRRQDVLKTAERLRAEAWRGALGEAAKAINAQR